MRLTYTTTNLLCAATDVGMHGLLSIINVTILCYPSYSITVYIVDLNATKRVLPFCVTPL